MWFAWCHCHSIISCFIKIQNGLPCGAGLIGCPGKVAIKWVFVFKYINHFWVIVKLLYSTEHERIYYIWSICQYWFSYSWDLCSHISVFTALFGGATASAQFLTVLNCLHFYYGNSIMTPKIALFSLSYTIACSFAEFHENSITTFCIILPRGRALVAKSWHKRE